MIFNIISIFISLNFIRLNFRMMKKILLLYFFILSLSITYSQVDKAYEQKVKQMMEVSGGRDAYDAAIGQMFSMYKEQFKEIPETFWKEFEKEFKSISMDELVRLVAPIYGKYLTSKDLDAIISFYTTEEGKKLANSQGAITAESMSVGQEWGAVLGDRILKKLEEKGY